MERKVPSACGDAIAGLVAATGMNGFSSASKFAVALAACKVKCDQARTSGKLKSCGKDASYLFLPVCGHSRAEGVMVQFEAALKGPGFSLAVNIAFSLRLQPLRDGNFQTAPLPPKVPLGSLPVCCYRLFGIRPVQNRCRRALREPNHRGKPDGSNESVRGARCLGPRSTTVHPTRPRLGMGALGPHGPACSRIAGLSGATGICQS